ncbi:crotonyl-CoA carboxylase/reductase [Spirillospora sp. CA-294931]|uniref:crotonyl-CoA carboxylase/reductase n=1 Tax=Spirillospora sp. CA-294931 TaxID=3240042 RepID=UPI003D8BEA18
MDSLATAVLAGAPAQELERLAAPDEYTALHLRAEDAGMFEGAADKDVRQSLRLGRVPLPELAPDEVLVAVMASSINYNTVWSALFEPLPTFGFLKRFAKQGGWAERHDQPYHVIGSDGSGVIVRVGSGVRRWKVGDHVILSPAYIDDQEPATHADGMLGAEQRAWGFETNFGGLAHYAVVRATQLLHKPPHLTWEESASYPLCAGTIYRMLVGERGARMKQGDVVLIWGATGGLGSYAVQMVKNGGGVPVGVVSSPEKERLAWELGCDVVINRNTLGIGGAEGPAETIEAGKRLGSVIRAEIGEDPHIALDYTGKNTFGISVFAVRRGGTVVTCGSSSGYDHHYDNRHLWMRLKRIVGSHIANLQEQWEMNRLVTMGRLSPVLSAVYPLDQAAEAARQVQTNAHVAKVGVLCLAPSEGLGVTDPALRERIGEDRINPARKAIR